MTCARLGLGSVFMSGSWMNDACMLRYSPSSFFSSDIQSNDLRQGVHVGTESVAGEWSNIEYLD